MRRAFSLLLAVGVAAVPSLAHKGKEHAPPEVRDTGMEAVGRVNERYLREVKPVFERKCFDCHAAPKRLPWYAKIPGPKQLIEHDMREAKKHLDMRQDFPFSGHGTPLEDLEAIEKTLEDGSMPPWRYRVMHRGSALSEEEKARVGAWIKESADILRAESARVLDPPRSRQGSPIR